MDEDEEFDNDSGIDTDEEVKVALTDAAMDFDASMKAKFSAIEYKKLRTIGAFIMRGLTLKESCILARINPEKLEQIMELNEDVRSFIEFKEISFKASILSTLSVSASHGKQAKSAMYMLENKFRDEFGKKTKGDLDRPLDGFARVIEFVRTEGDKSKALIPGPKT